jgi:predicted nuclease with TOPRIM domain
VVSNVAMSDAELKLLLEELDSIRAKIDELKADMIEVKERLGFIESQYASLSRRVDRIGGDVELIKRRLELAEA